MKPNRISLSINDKIGLINNLATMLAAGISILEAVDSLLEDSKGNQKKIIETLRGDLVQGRHVYETFAQFPNTFDQVTVNIIKASEEAGTLDTTLKDLTKSIEKQREFNDKVKSAVMYPILISIVFVGVMLMILIVVVPKIATVFTRMNVELPLPTRIMIFVSDLILHHTLSLSAGIIIVIAALIATYRLKRRAFIRIIFLLPLVRELVKEIDLTRFTRSMSYLLSSGIPITSALELSSEIVIRKDVAETILRTRDMVLGGKRLSEGFKTNKKVIPTIMLKMVEAGEKTGTLDVALLEVAEHLDYRVSSTLKILTSLLEPVMLVLVGICIGGMMLAIIAPIYGLIGQVGQY